jgi:hypothetical protein
LLFLLCLWKEEIPSAIEVQLLSDAIALEVMPGEFDKFSILEDWKGRVTKSCVVDLAPKNGALLFVGVIWNHVASLVYL